jgi:hypothetical protein
MGKFAKSSNTITVNQETFNLCKKLGSILRRGRDSGKAIVTMKKKSPSQWTEAEWSWARRQVSFISRMLGSKGPLHKDGKKTRKLLSLLVWGHNPEKNT